MQDRSTAPSAVLQFRQDLQATLRDGARRAIETVLEEELLAALGADDQVRKPTRRGYRHGTTERTLTTREGTRPITVPPRVGCVRPTGPSRSFRAAWSRAMRGATREADEALLGCYFGGVNSRRIRTALKPLPGKAHFSKSTVSRVVARVKDHFTTWQQRPLSDERYAVVFLDAVHLRVFAGRVISVPVLPALGVTEHGQKQLVALQLAAAEATASWGGLLADLQRRGLPAPLLVITDGHADTKKALEAWPTVQVQRCTTHKGRNIEDACPVHARPELRRE